jgi:hypothetical protein
MRTTESALQMATQQPAALKIIGPIGIAVGLALFVGAIADPGRFFSRMFEENEDSRLGFWAVTNTPEGFRGWIAFTGLFIFAIGITMTVIVY